MRDHEPAVALPLGHGQHQLRQLAIAVGVHLHAPERIHRARIEAARDEQEVGREAIERRHDHALEGGHVGAPARRRAAAAR